MLRKNLERSIFVFYLGEVGLTTRRRLGMGGAEAALMGWLQKPEKRCLTSVSDSCIVTPLCAGGLR